MYFLQHPRDHRIKVVVETLARASATALRVSGSPLRSFFRAHVRDFLRSGGLHATG